HDQRDEQLAGATKHGSTLLAMGVQDYAETTAGLELSSAAAAALLREQPRAIRERLELQRIAAGIEQEHRGLFAGLALEADMRLDHETRARRLQPLGQRLPCVHLQ